MWSFSTANKVFREGAADVVDEGAAGGCCCGCCVERMYGEEEEREEEREEGQSPTEKRRFLWLYTGPVVATCDAMRCRGACAQCP